MGYFRRLGWDILQDKGIYIVGLWSKNIFLITEQSRNETAIGMLQS